MRRPQNRPPHAHPPYKDEDFEDPEATEPKPNDDATVDGTSDQVLAPIEPQHGDFREPS